MAYDNGLSRRGLLEKGAALSTIIVPLDGMRDAYEQAAYRTTITAIMTP